MGPRLINRGNQAFVNDPPLQDQPFRAFDQVDLGDDLADPDMC
jgi:hypothetical protein